VPPVAWRRCVFPLPDTRYRFTQRPAASARGVRSRVRTAQPAGNRVEGTTQPSRWKFHDPVLLYLYPATYSLHLLEEWFATAPIVHWGLSATRPLAALSFLGANAAGLLLMILGIHLVRSDARFHWVVAALATAVILNTAGHVVGSIAIRGYAAGLITAVILWIPLGLLTLLRVWDQASSRTLGAGLLVGVVIEVVVTAMLPVVGS
jgi:hypothetical protein